MTDLYVNPDGVFDRLVVLAEDAIITSNPEKSVLAGGGEGLAALALANGTRIPYAAIQSIKANRLRDDLNIRYRQAAESRLTNIGFKDATVRNLALRSIHKRLGPQFRVREKQYSAGRAALAPILTTVTIVGFTYISMLAATDLARGVEAQVRGRHQLVKSIYLSLLHTLGPTGVLLAGTLVTLASVAWLVLRVKRPPRMITIAA
jgi:hypothetical protein